MTTAPLVEATAVRMCEWCRVVPLTDLRVDAITCGRKCRQNRHAFMREIAALRVASTSRRIGYADPPYPGLAGYYVGHPDYAGEVDHDELIGRLALYDGYALSTSADALSTVLELFRRRGVEHYVAAWVRGGRPGRSRRARSSWEPVIYRPARSVVLDDAGVDSLVANAGCRRADRKRTIGAKPAAFASWLFGLVQARAGDTFDDLYPGSGGMTRAWEMAASNG